MCVYTEGAKGFTGKAKEQNSICCRQINAKSKKMIKILLNKNSSVPVLSENMFCFQGVIKYQGKERSPTLE